MRFLWLLLIGVVCGCDAAESGSPAADAGADATLRADGRVGDAAADQGVPALDAAPDARRDAQPTDARPADAEAADARLGDARPDAAPDVVLPADAAPPDASPPDAAQPDAAQPDAAQPDAAVGPIPPEPVPPHLVGCPPEVAPDEACDHLENPRVSLFFEDPQVCGLLPIPCDGGRAFAGPCGCGCISETPRCGCPRIAEPVCGVDGVTRLNPCEARLAQVAIDHAGACDPAWCVPGDALNVSRAPPGQGCAAPERQCGAEQVVIDDACGCGCLQPGLTCPDLFDPGVRYASFRSVDCFGGFACNAGSLPFAGACGCGCAQRSDCPPPDGRDVIYASPDPHRCQGVPLNCPAGTTPFNNRCGCGCLVPPPDCNCPDVDEPICGEAPGGRVYTYPNPCRLACDGAVAEPGRCQPEPMAPPCGFGGALVNGRCMQLCAGNEGCPRGEVCRLQGGMCLRDPACPDCGGCLGACVVP